mgnify:FL=1
MAPPPVLYPAPDDKHPANQDILFNNRNRAFVSMH